MDERGNPKDAARDWRTKMMAGKERMRRRCMATALKYTPGGVVQVKIRGNLSGRASVWADDGGSFMGLRKAAGKFKIAAPRPVTRKSLYLFLHECAHVHLGHCELKFGDEYAHGWTYGCHKPRHVQEMEAEKQAHEWMRAEGIPVPKEMTKRAKRYVGWKIRQAEARGCKKVDERAKKFADR